MKLSADASAGLAELLGRGCVPTAVGGVRWRGAPEYAATPVARRSTPRHPWPAAGEDAAVGAEVECVELERERRRRTNNLGR